jgi:hypothetical protein
LVPRTYLIFVPNFLLSYLVMFLNITNGIHKKIVNQTKLFIKMSYSDFHIIHMFAVTDVAMQHLIMSNDELWLTTQFTEDMDRRFQVRNFTSNSRADRLCGLVVRVPG